MRAERVVASMEVDHNEILLPPVSRSSLKVVDDSTNSADNLGEIAKAFKATIMEDVRLELWVRSLLTLKIFHSCMQRLTGRRP